MGGMMTVQGRISGPGTFKREQTMRMIVAVLAVSAIGLVQACTVVPPISMVEGAFVVGGDKTIADHVISLNSGKNCSFIRKERGLTYCEEDQVTVQPNVYCYKTLGEVTCYDRPDPRYQKLGVNEQNKPK